VGGGEDGADDVGVRGEGDEGLVDAIEYAHAWG
jgi:hypothetical protein